MALQTQQRPRPQDPQVQMPAYGTPPAGPEQPATGERSVIVQHGIHRGHFPVAGLRVREVRQTLAGLLNIDPRAVPVVNGQVVSEDTVVGEDVTMLSFVKPSAIKG